MPESDGRAEAPLTPRRLRLGLLVVAGIGATAGLLIAVLAGGRDLLGGLAALPLATILAALGLNVASWFGEAVVFYSLAPERPKRAAGRGPLRSVLRMVPVYVGGGFPALVTPFGSGGVPGWIWGLTVEGLLPGEAAAVVGARALLTSLFFVSAGAVALAVVPIRASGGRGASIAGVAALAAVLVAVAWIVGRPQRIVRALERVLRSGASERLLGRERVGRLVDAVTREVVLFSSEMRALARARPRALAAAVGGLLFSRACLLAILPLIMTGMGWRGSWGLSVAIVVAVQALASASPTPGGSGTTEAALTAALAAVAPLTLAGAAALTWRGITFYFELAFGWVFFATLLARRRRGL